VSTGGERSSANKKRRAKGLRDAFRKGRTTQLTETKRMKGRAEIDRGKLEKREARKGGVNSMLRGGGGSWERGVQSCQRN